MESIRQMGVANPLIVRPDPDGRYEIIFGHRHHHAAELVGMDTIPVIMMVDSNLQRENILPSERAKAYKMKLDELKHPPDLAHARIYDRILERCAPILFAGKNFREDNATSTKAAARQIITTPAASRPQPRKENYE